MARIVDRGERKNLEQARVREDVVSSPDTIHGKCIDLVLRRNNGDDDKTSLTTVTSTAQDSVLSAQSQSIRSIYERRDLEGHVLQRYGGGRVFSYRKKKTRLGNGIFSAPAGVNPHHVASSIVRRNTGGSRLIFIWPQKTRTRGRVWTILAPLMHGILIGLLCMDAIHLWPGEFLPTSLPSTTPIPLPPVKSKPKRKAFLNLLLNARENNENPMTDEDLREQVDTVMFAGHDTTAAAISWTLFCLGNYPEIQEKVHEELQDIFGDSNEPATTKEISQLKYLDRVAKEALRLYPSAPGFLTDFEKEEISSIPIDFCKRTRRTDIHMLIYHLARVHETVLVRNMLNWKKNCAFTYINGRFGETMSGSDGKEDQCERAKEGNLVPMSEALVKNCTHSDPQCCFNVDFMRLGTDMAGDIEEETIVSSDITDYASLTSMTVDENEVDTFDREIAYSKNSEYSIVSTCPEVSSNGLPAKPLAIHSPSRKSKESCSCDVYKANREMFREELQAAMKFQNLWSDLRQQIRIAFNTALEVSRSSDSMQSQRETVSLIDMHDTVTQLCKRDPHQLFMRLVSQAQEFVVEVKVRLLALLHDRSVNNLAEIFLVGLLDDYDALISTASQISKIVKPLKKHLCKFNLTWDCFIKKLYQIYVYNDPLVQNNLPPFIVQLRKLLPLKGLEYQGLVRRYLSFDDEMITIGSLWPEIEPWMDKYNAEQAVRMTQLRDIREGWELFTAIRKIMEQRKLIKLSDDGSELQEIDGQLSALIEQGKMSASGSDGRPSSPTPDFSLDSLSMPQCLEVVQILLDDWNKARHQKLVDIARALTVRHMVTNENDPDSLAYAHTSDHLEQFAVKKIRSHSKDMPLEDNFVEEETDCGCYECTKPLLSPVGSNGDLGNIELPTDNVNYFPIIANGLMEHIINFTTNNSSSTEVQLKKTLEEMEDRSSQKEENNIILKTVAENIDVQPLTPQPCQCVYQHAKEIADRKKGAIEDPPCPCLLNSKRKWDTCPCLTKFAEEPVVNNSHPKGVSSNSVAVNCNQELSKPAVKTGTTQSTQTQTRHSTTQTPNSTHNRITLTSTTHPYTHGPVSDMTKNTVPSHKLHAHNNHNSHACHKQTNIEHIKRVSCNDLSSGDGDCSDSASSQEDSCSTSSSAQRDSSRHCDCCYCEVFGHGVPSVAPVSRNYNEMRERLRQILTKKKAKKCKATYSTPKSLVDVTLPLPSVNQEAKAITNNLAPRSNTPVSTTLSQDQQDQRDLEELLDFIEGNQNGKKDNNKKAEKKARQKQRKLQEKMKKDRQEAEKQKLIELQKKTPEVTITVVDPQKPVSQRFLPQCNLPEVSILPTNPNSLSTGKHLTNKKKDKQETCNVNNSNFISKTKIASVNTNLKMKNISSMDKSEQTSNCNQRNKIDAKNELSNKTFKTATNINVLGTKDNTNHMVDKFAAMELVDKNLTKKERKKLRREMKKQEQAKTTTSEELTQMENQPQIVTIKRIMESNSTEPTVTITLKGQTPAEDKVLFTLVNGQTKEAPLHKSEQEQNLCNSNKKKKSKAANSTDTTQNHKFQQANSTKQQQSKVCDAKHTKQQTNNEKTKAIKQPEERKTQQLTISETKNAKSKKEKKNSETKENVSQQQQQNIISKSKNLQQNAQAKKTNKSTNVIDSLKCNVSFEPAIKAKGQQDKMNDSNASKSKKTVNITNANKTPKNEQQKFQISKGAASTVKQGSMIPSASDEVINSSLSTQFKDISLNSKINIENLKLPPGITITKVDAPAKPLPIKSAPMPKPVNPPKQTTIIAAPMSGVQSSYASPQAGGNVIVVDTGKLKQDLLPKPTEIELSKDVRPSQATTTSKKKKKKKNKNSSNSGNAIQTTMKNGECMSNENTDESARILHNPSTNMVTIRNPAFGPMKVPPTQQAAIIKVSENGMVTIRSPALQQAINAGLTAPSKPDYIVKGDISSNAATLDAVSMSVKRTNDIIPPSLAELRSRLTPDCTGLAGLANIQISKVTNGQPIPENGINLKGTSVTLTKVRTDTILEDVHQTKAAVREAINASITASTSGKSKKKKKRGNCTRQCGDDWNLVESVFTPKDIDLEDGEMDDAERELEAFKRFCLQSVPPPRKEKVNLNIKDIVLKKKSSSSATAAAIAAN
ncbi:hypothetical protein KPH14_008139 [Odynerus spinipes]|uniref:FAM193 C-terminal domain-containing protein n=1 Tax=Odynerus spinipes TaxID=1348599 RepID=A0AAD9R9G9_9HYME|nr:hypothetical protein KPH14_008139 [Odynerus spinipes]